MIESGDTLDLWIFSLSYFKWNLCVTEICGKINFIYQSCVGHREGMKYDTFSVKVCIRQSGIQIAIQSCCKEDQWDSSGLCVPLSARHWEWAAIWKGITEGES